MGRGSQPEHAYISSMCVYFPVTTSSFTVIVKRMFCDFGWKKSLCNAKITIQAVEKELICGVILLKQVDEQT